MARKASTVVRFKEAKAGMHDAFNAAIKEAVLDGVETAQTRAEQSGYDINPFNIHRKHFHGTDGHLDGGMIFVPSEHWYYRFLETGTVYIAAKPFIRPGGRQMTKTFINMVGRDNVERAIRRKTRLP